MTVTNFLATMKLMGWVRFNRQTNTQITLLNSDRTVVITVHSDFIDIRVLLRTGANPCFSKSIQECSNLQKTLNYISNLDMSSFKQKEITCN